MSAPVRDSRAATGQRGHGFVPSKLTSPMRKRVRASSRSISGNQSQTDWTTAVESNTSKELVMYAVVTTVKIVPGQFETGRKDLHERVVPQVRQAPGFVKGYWLIRDDHAQGLS